LRKLFLITMMTLIFAAFGCSGGSVSSPTVPDGQNTVNGQGTSGTSCLGIWQFTIDAKAKAVDITELRTSDLSLNVLPFMEPPVLKNLTIDFNTLSIDQANDYIGVDVIFTHPFVTPDGVFRGFDVRGVVFGPEVTDADGYTPLLRPKDFISEPFGYVDGLLGTPQSAANYQRDENGFKYFCDGLGADALLKDFFSDEANLADRGSFGEGKQNKRHYDLDFAAGESNFFVFNYAVLANYDWPAGDPPYALDDFPIASANMAEAFCFSNTIGENTLYFDGTTGGGKVSLDVEVWDWQGFDDTAVTITNAALGGTVAASSMLPGGTSKSAIFHFDQVPGTPTTTADLDVLLTVTDNSKTFGSSWFMNLLKPGNPLSDQPVYSKWYITIAVGTQPPYINIIPVEGQINLDIIITTFSTYPPKDIGVDSSNGKPKVYYGSDADYSHVIMRFTPNYSASDGQVIWFGTGGPGGWMDCAAGWTTETFGYLWDTYYCLNAWCVMDESGMLPNYTFWWYGGVSPVWGRDCFETDDASHENYLYVLHDAGYASEIRLQYFMPSDGYYPTHWGPSSSSIYNQPGSDGIVGADIIAADALRNSTNMVVLEGTDVELWDFTTLVYGGSMITGFVNPLDVSVDSQDYIWVLDQPDGKPRLQAFDPMDGKLIAASGEMDASWVSGTPLRIDLDESDDQCHLLHSKGVTVFKIDW